MALQADPNITPCPDPSAHENGHSERKLQDSAAGAALYATSKSGNANYPLGADKRLSSAGAAASLKYARAQDLPSFPSVGIDTQSSGLTAATLAHGNKTKIEWWTPELSADASKAALLANDYKMKPLWKHEASKNGHSAATIAMRNKGLSPQLDYGYTEQGRNNSMLAARSASVKGRKRSDSVPESVNSYPDAHKAKSNALGAATSANNASRLRPNSMAREMFTEHPPVDIEVQEKRHQDALQASAISMAKKMYAMQTVDDDGNVTIDAGETAANTAFNSAKPTDSAPDLKTQAMQYLTLQDAAQRLAAERLAKIDNQHEHAAFRDYWGQPGQSKRGSRLSFKPDRRRRAASTGTAGRNLDVDSDDDSRQARRVRAQMNQFSTQLADVDAKKRGQDRQNLMAAAEKKVQAQMSKLDEKIYNETGKMTPAMTEDWDNKARSRAAAASEARMQNHGKVNIGGGKFMDQSEIDQIAAARIQPTLDEITETAEKQRARDEEIRLDQAEVKRIAQVEKQRQADAKQEQKRIKNEEKQAEKTKKQEEKQAAKLERQADKEKKASVKQENRKSGEVTEPVAETAEPVVKTAVPEIASEKTIPAVAEPKDEIVGREGTGDSSAVASSTLMASGANPPANTTHPPVTEGDKRSTSVPKKRFSTLLGKLKRKPKADEPVKEKSFQGGTALTGATVPQQSTPVAAAAAVAAPRSSTAAASSSIGSLYALDDDIDDDEPARGRTKSRLSLGGSDEFEEARDNFDETLAPPPTFGSAGKSNSPIRETKFHEAL